MATSDHCSEREPPPPQLPQKGMKKGEAPDLILKEFTVVLLQIRRHDFTNKRKENPYCTTLSCGHIHAINLNFDPPSSISPSPIFHGGAV